MKKALLLSIAALFLSGCFYTKLVKPEIPIGAPGPAPSSAIDAVRISYKVKGVPSALKPLLDTFSALGIQDVKESEKTEKGRITLLVYPLEVKSGKTDRYIGFPWGVVSFATLCLVPYHFEEIRPVEIYVIDPAREYDKQISVVRTEYETTNWMWMPFLLSSGVSTGGDVAHGTGSALDKVIYTAWRRMYTQVVADALKSHPQEQEANSKGQFRAERP